MKWLDDRKVETLTVTIGSKGKPTDVGSVMLRHKAFGDIVTSSGLEFESADASTITLRGRRKNLRRFKKAFDTLDKVGVV